MGPSANSLSASNHAYEYLTVVIVVMLVSAPAKKFVFFCFWDLFK